MRLLVGDSPHSPIPFQCYSYIRLSGTLRNKWDASFSTKLDPKGEFNPIRLNRICCVLNGAV